MLLLMMNSRRANPTPLEGICAKFSANCGLPTFIMILIGAVRQFALLDLTDLRLDQARRKHKPVSPSLQATVTNCPSLSLSVAS